MYLTYLLPAEWLSEDPLPHWEVSSYKILFPWKIRITYWYNIKIDIVTSCKGIYRENYLHPLWQSHIGIPWISIFSDTFWPSTPRTLGFSSNYEWEYLFYIACPHSCWIFSLHLLSIQTLPFVFFQINPLLLTLLASVVNMPRSIWLSLTPWLLSPAHPVTCQKSINCCPLALLAWCKLDLNRNIKILSCIGWERKM